MASRSRFIAVLPVALASVAVGAILTEPLPIPVQYLGPVSGEPEKDTYGRNLSGRTPDPPSPRYTQRPELLGAATGNPEKDTFGFVVLRGDTHTLAAKD